MARKQEEAIIDRGELDVFHDPGLPDADELLAKPKLARAIAEAIKERKVSQSQLARLTGTDQPKISQLMNGRESGFSSDRLMHTLSKHDQDVVTFIRPRPASEKPAAYVSVDLAHRL